MARRGRKYGPLSGLKRAASNAQRKTTIGKTTAIYELMWGEKPQRGRPKKNSSSNFY